MRPAVVVRTVEDRRLFAISLMMVAFMCFTGIDTSAKWLVTHGLPVEEVVFVRYLGHLILVVGLFAPALGMRLFKSNRPALSLLRATALMCSTALNFVALQYLPLTMTISIFFASPLIICALSIPILGESVGWRRWVAILVGFLGILIVVRPGLADVHWAVLVSITCTFCASLYIVLTRKMAGVDATEVQQVYAGGVATFCFLPFALMNWQWPHNTVDWIPFLAIGFFGWAGHQCLTIAHHYAPASVLAPFVYVQILFMVASGWFIFNSVPDIWVLVGAMVVMASGLYIWLRERQLKEGG
ncbi:DMT family transporter [Rhodobacteraceae bacterium NNCM2]|nr:DMT family transporter [Coraliihabitans acroporae]